MSEALQKVYGIDLGTTYSCIAVVDDAQKPVVIRNSDNEAITPSVVFFDGQDVIVGSVAKEHAQVHPENVVEMVKRLMGDPNAEFEIQGKRYRPEEISAFILRKLTSDAEQQTSEQVNDVVITCPAYFGANQREATAVAGQIAGLNVRRIINEPTAAAISYGLDTEGESVVLVFDLGGGTFDTTMIDISESAIRVVCTGGDHNLGGREWDIDIVNFLVEEFQRQTGIVEDPRDHPESLQDLLLQAERCKKTLSQRESTMTMVRHGGESAKVEMTRDKFVELTSALLERTVELTRDMLRDASDKGYDRIDKILLAGGSSRMPQVRSRLEQEFDVPTELFDPDECVAKGAALVGWHLALNGRLIELIAEQTGQDIESVDLDQTEQRVVEEGKERLADEANVPVPALGTAVRTTVEDVSSKTFGIVVQDERRQEYVYNLILRNDTVPADRDQTFYTVDDNQQAVDVRLMEHEGDEETAEVGACSLLGQAELALPRQLPGGSPIDVSFRLNEQGRLEVTAVEPTTGEAITITVDSAGVMSQEDVQVAYARGLTIDVS